MDLNSPSGRQALGRRIQAAIVDAGYPSLSVFAQRLGCSRALIYQYVKGDVLVQLDRLQTIAELTGQPLRWFLADEADTGNDEVEELRSELAQVRQSAADLHAAVAREQAARLKERDQHRGRLVDALRESCAALRRAGDARALLECAQRLETTGRDGGDEPAALLARLHMAYAAYELGEMDRARDAATDALRLAQAQGNTSAEDSARQELFRALLASGRLEEAREQLVHLAGQDRWWPRWSSRVSLAAVAEQVGDLDEAEARLEEAESVVEAPTAPDEQRFLARAYVHSNRVNVLVARGRYEDALQANAVFRSLAERAGLPDQLREAALNEAICNLRLGHLEAADEQLERLREWSLHSGDRRLEALTSVFESERLRRGGDAAGAKRAARVAIEEANGNRDGHVLVEAELALGEAYLAEGRPDDARYYLERCLSRATRLQYRRLGMAAQLALDRAALAEGEAGAARRLRANAQAALAQGYEDLHADALRAVHEARNSQREV